METARLDNAGAGGTFNAGKFIKTLIAVALPAISIAMMFLGWIRFSGSSAENVNSVISSCAGYANNRLISAMADGSLSPAELPGTAQSARELARFFAVTDDAETLEMIVHAFRLMGAAVILSFISGAATIALRVIKPLKKARRADVVFFIFQLLIFAGLMFMAIRINSYIKDIAQAALSFSDITDVSMAVTPWGIIALICAMPSCVVDLIRFPGSDHNGHAAHPQEIRDNS